MSNEVVFVVFKLPDREEMIKRLSAIPATLHLQEHFYPLLTKHEGKEVTLSKLIDLLVTAIHEYTQTMPDGTEHSIKLLMYVNAVWFVRALTDDKDVVVNIKKHFLAMLETL